LEKKNTYTKSQIKSLNAQRINSKTLTQTPVRGVGIRVIIDKNVTNLSTQGFAAHINIV